MTKPTYILEFYHDNDFPVHSFNIPDSFSIGSSAIYYITTDPPSTFNQLTESIRSVDFTASVDRYRGVTLASWLEDQQLTTDRELHNGNWYVALYKVKD